MKKERVALFLGVFFYLAWCVLVGSSKTCETRRGVCCVRAEEQEQKLGKARLVRAHALFRAPRLCVSPPHSGGEMSAGQKQEKGGGGRAALESSRVSLTNKKKHAGVWSGACPPGAEHSSVSAWRARGAHATDRGRASVSRTHNQSKHCI